MAHLPPSRRPGRRAAGDDCSARKGAIILGTNVNGIGAIRSLGRLGVACGAIYSPLGSDHALHSKYLKAAHCIAADAASSEIEKALRIVTGTLRADRPVLIATTDKYSEFLSRNKALLSQDYELACADIGLFDLFLDKWKTVGFCQTNNLPIPTTHCPKTIDQLRVIAADLRYPVIVKPRYTFNSAFPGKNAVFAEPPSLISFFQNHEILGDAVIQEIIPSGDGNILVTVSYSGTDGKVRAMYSGRRIRQCRPDYGAACFAVSEKQTELEKISRAFLNSIKYEGFAMLEFARSRDDGSDYFLELNTRVAYSNQLFSDAGVDLTQVGYLDIIGQDFRKVLGQVEQRDGVVWLDMRRDFASMKIKRRQGQISVWEWLRSIVRARSFAYWSWRDPKPFFAACLWRIRRSL